MGTAKGTAMIIVGIVLVVITVHTFSNWIATTYWMEATTTPIVIIVFLVGLALTISGVRSRKKAKREN